MIHGEEDGALGMSVSDALEGEPQDAWRALLATLRGEDDACPWLTALGSGGAGDSGVVAPAALASAIARLRETGTLAAACDALEADGNDASGLQELGAFLQRTADAGAWVVWRNV